MRRQQGFGIIAAIVILVMLAALAAAIATLTSTQNQTAAQNTRSAQAWQSARAGNEWGFYQATHGGGCATTTLNLGNGFKVTVTCTAYNYNEGQTGPAPYTDKTVRIYRIVSIACPSTAVSCPDNAAAVTAGYVERTRVLILTE